MDRPGSAVLPARLMLDLARALPGPDSTPELRSSEEDVEITSGGATLRVVGIPRRSVPSAAASKLFGQ